MNKVFSQQDGEIIFQMEVFSKSFYVLLMF